MAKVVTRHDVIEAYEKFLGRLPENEVAITSKIDAGLSKVALWRSFLDCDEFKQFRFGTHYREPSPYVETECDEASAAAILDRVQTTWAQLGEEDPYWSVLTEDRYRSANADQHLERFYASGTVDGALVDLVAGNAKVNVPRGTCLELGAGVGRITQHLAPRFNEVRAWDISPGNLRIAERHLTDRGISNVRFHHVKGLDDFAQADPIDFFYSLIVLQHNPPPIQYRILSLIFDKIRLGGFALFQTPSRLPGYSFSVSAYLARAAHQDMEMHCLPMPIVLRLLSEKGFSLLEILPDQWTGAEGSFTYFARRDRLG